MERTLRPREDPIRAFWCRIPSRPNFGDALTPWLIRRITGQAPAFVRPEDPRPKYFVAGSILSYVGPRCIVWGSGISTRDDLVLPQARLLAVRGPLSRAVAIECGADCPAVYGDPAMLLPSLYQPPPGVRRGIGVVAHYSDWPRVRGRCRVSESLRLIDIQAPIESVIDRIAGCEAVLSASLHGLIASHAYGIPAIPVTFRDTVADDARLCDYYLSLGQEPPPPRRLDEACRNAVRVAESASLPRMPDLGPLWSACPFGAGA